MGYDPNRENDGINRLTGKIIRRASGASSGNISVAADKQLIRQQNELILKWTPKVRTALRRSARWFSDGKFSSPVIRHQGNQIEKKLAQSIASKIGKQYGLASYIGYSFERHGVFVHKGVGRGYKASGQGFVIRTAQRQPDPHQRYAVEWFNPVLDKYLPELADGIAGINADAVVNATRMRIK